MESSKLEVIKVEQHYLGLLYEKNNEILSANQEVESKIREVEQLRGEITRLSEEIDRLKLDLERAINRANAETLALEAPNAKVKK